MFPTYTPGACEADGLTEPPSQRYNSGRGGGPRRPVVPTLGSKGVAAPTPEFPRRQRAEVAPKLIGIVMPGRAWVLGSREGRVKLMFTNALAVPTTSHRPALGEVGSTVAGTPRVTTPKPRSASEVIVMPLPTISALTGIVVEKDCAPSQPGASARSAGSSSRLTGLRPRPNPGPPAREARPSAGDRSARTRL